MILLLISVTAHGWECIVNENFGCNPSTCMWAAGNSLTYHWMVTDSVHPEVVVPLAWQFDEIDAGAGNWHAGTSQRLRGANWQFIRGTDAFTYSVSDTTNHVVMLENVDFDDICPDTEGCVVTPTYNVLNGCGRKGWDFLIRSEAVRGAGNSDIPWGEGVIHLKEERDPAVQGAFLDFSLEMLATTEFGHVLGFGHNLTVSSVMGGFPAANVGGTMSINEEEYDVMTDIKPHTSTGNNVALSRATATILQDGVMWNAERWDPKFEDVGEELGGNFVLCIGDAPAAPDQVFAAIDLLHLGTAPLYEVVVEWRLRPSGGTCGGAGTYLLDSRTIGTLTSGIPFSIRPDSNLSVPAGVTAGNWTLCARVDPGNVITETSEWDNSVASERPLIVLSDPTNQSCP